MPEETYDIQLDGDQINTALARVHGADDTPTAASENMVKSGGLFTYLESFRASSGFAVYKDSQYTEVSPLTANNARVHFTVDGLGSSTYTEQLPTGVTQLWDTDGSYIDPENDGDGYMIRIDFRYKADAQNAYFDVELDISPTGDGSNVILLDTILCIKAANTEARYSETHFIYSRSTFVANNGRLFVNSTDDGSMISVYDATVNIGRFHKAIAAS